MKISEKKRVRLKRKGYVFVIGEPDKILGRWPYCWICRRYHGDCLQHNFGEEFIAFMRLAFIVIALISFLIIVLLFVL